MERNHLFQTIIIVLIIFLFWTESKYSDEIHGSDNAVIPNSTRYGVTFTQPLKTTFELCTGKPQERRQLAELGDDTTKDQWLEMKRCMEEREEELVGVYSLHVSKSGGTSLCDLLKEEQCFISPHNPNANCWSNRYRTQVIDLGPQWQRKKKSEAFGFPEWVLYNETAVPSSSCDQIVQYLQDNNQKVAMSENWLPEGGNLCQNYFSNIVVIRDPMRRVLSHYQHLYRACMSKKTTKGLKRDQCHQMLHGGIWNEESKNYFNLTFMMEWFDIVSDNYYVRSLNDQSVYKEPFGMNGKGGMYLQHALRNLRNFDWIILIQSGNDEEDINRELIIKYGLGLENDFGISRKKREKKSDIILRENDYKIMKKLNKYDQKIWSEAKRLNSLDVISLKKYAEYDTDWSKKRSSHIECCGRICVPS